LAKEATLSSTLPRNLAQVSGTALTGRDWSADFAHLAYVGGHRFRTVVYDSGSLTVGAGAWVSTLSISGVGYVQGVVNHRSVGVPAGYAFNEYNVDAQGFMWCWLHGFLDLSNISGWGLGSVGWHLNRIRVHAWDTATNTYEVMNMFLPRRMNFRSSLEGRLGNTHPTDSSTQVSRITYELFVSSKRILCKLPKFIDARALRAKAGSKELAYPLVVESLGYFEKEEEHPYRDHLADIPNEWDDELTLPDGTKVRSASPKKAKTVLTLIVPEDWKVERALGKIKVEKVLSEE